MCLCRGPAAHRNCDWGRDGKTTPTRRSISFHRHILRPSRPRIFGAIVCRGPGVQPPARCGRCVTVWDLRVRLCQGACRPSELRLGRGRTHHTSLTTNHFSSTEALARPFAHIHGNRRGVRGWQPPGRGGLRCSGVCLSLLPGLMPNLTEHKNRITTQTRSESAPRENYKKKRGISSCA